MSEDTLSRVGDTDQLRIQLGMVHQEGAADEMGEGLIEPAGINPTVPSASDQTDQIALDKLSALKLHGYSHTKLGERAAEQFSHKIEGTAVSEDTLSRVGDTDQLRIQLGMVHQEGAADEMGEGLIEPAKVSPADISILEQRGVLHKLSTSKSVGYPPTESSMEIAAQLPEKIGGQIALLAEKWFETNKGSVVSQNGLANEANTAKNLQPEIYNLQSNPITPLVNNTFNIQLSQNQKKSVEDIQLLEERINKILVEQAKRYGILV